MFYRNHRLEAKSLAGGDPRRRILLVHPDPAGRGLQVLLLDGVLDVLRRDAERGELARLHELLLAVAQLGGHRVHGGDHGADPHVGGGPPPPPSAAHEKRPMTDV